MSLRPFLKKLYSFSYSTKASVVEVVVHLLFGAIFAMTRTRFLPRAPPFYTPPPRLIAITLVSFAPRFAVALGKYLK